MFGGSLSQLRKYDVLATLPVTGVQVTYECKRDRLAHKTGNVAVEHKAILHSQADFIVYLIDGDANLYQIGRENLIRSLKENWQGSRAWRVVQGGEFHDYMTLIPVGEFMGMCSVI
jgi:hypothetical protein